MKMVVGGECQVQGVEEGSVTVTGGGLTGSRGERGEDEIDIEGKGDEEGGDLTHGGGSILTGERGPRRGGEKVDETRGRGMGMRVCGKTQGTHSQGKSRHREERTYESYCHLGVNTRQTQDTSQYKTHQEL